MCISGQTFAIASAALGQQQVIALESWWMSQGHESIHLERFSARLPGLGTDVPVKYYKSPKPEW